MSLDLYKKELPEIVRSLPPSTLSGIDEITITLFYHDHGYDWHHIPMTYDVAAYHQYAIFRADEKAAQMRGNERDKLGYESPIIHALHFITPYKPWTESRQQVISGYPKHLEVYDLW